jgi:uncharacterized membrane protein YfcA
MDYMDDVLQLLQIMPGSTEGFDKGWPMLVSIDGSPADPARHPFWIFDWGVLMHPQVMFCTVVLMFAGFLCSAGGVGGGGIYVTVLMVAGGLSPFDAVPLSKAIVFFGSMSSLVLNMRKSLTRTDSNTGEAKGLIDYNICRLVVPSALIGTLLGVLLNRTTSDFVIVSLLASTLLILTWMTCRNTYTQYTDEEKKLNLANVESSKPECQEAESPSLGEDNQIQEAPPVADSHDSEEKQPHVDTEAFETTPLIVSELKSQSGKKSMRNSLTTRDKLISLGVLLTVVICGVLRFHAGACELAVNHTGRGHRTSTWTTCHHPTVRVIGNSLESVMGGTEAHWVLSGALFVPTILCLGVMVHYGSFAMINEGWSVGEVLKYEAMSVCTGCLAGLVGIGGGLIFSPFFLLMGVEPAVAVATSSTCVIFTSSSTTLQYLFTDRIVMTLALAYGIVNLVASYLGTSFVHWLQDNYGTRKSYITGIVAAGVAISAGLSVAKLFSSESMAH